jgi:hypothetical protein
MNFLAKAIMGVIMGEKPARKGEKQQRALIICTKNVQLWHPFLGKGDTFEIW